MSLIWVGIWICNISNMLFSIFTLFNFLDQCHKKQMWNSRRWWREKVIFTLDTLSKSFFSIPHFNSGIDHFILLKWGIDFRNWIPNAGIEHFILLKWGIHFRNWELMPEVNSFTLLIKSGIDFRHRFPIPTSFRR